MSRISFFGLLTLALISPSTLAHTGETTGFTAGLLHVFTGFDHLISMIAIGVWAACLTKATQKTLLALTPAYADQITYVTDRPGHDARYAIDATKLEDELGWKAEENFDTGIEKTIKWYLENEWWWSPLRKHAAERKGVLKK